MFVGNLRKFYIGTILKHIGNDSFSSVKDSVHLHGVHKTITSDKYIYFQSDWYICSHLQINGTTSMVNKVLKTCCG